MQGKSSLLLVFPMMMKWQRIRAASGSEHVCTLLN